MLGLKFGYHPNGDKTWLVVKEALEDVAQKLPWESVCR